MFISLSFFVSSTMDRFSLAVIVCFCVRNDSTEEEKRCEDVNECARGCTLMALRGGMVGGLFPWQLLRRNVHFHGEPHAI